MISYELAKELKEARFPQTTDIRDLTCDCGITDCEIHGQEHERVYIPTLSELIEVCGDDFEGVRRVLTSDTCRFLYWLAECTNDRGICCQGDTPEEAVARLWLALNKK